MTPTDDPFADAAARVRPLDEAAMRAAAELHGRLTKPAGALGALEDLGVLLERHLRRGAAGGAGGAGGRRVRR